MPKTLDATADIPPAPHFLIHFQYPDVVLYSLILTTKRGLNPSKHNHLG